MPRADAEGPSLPGSSEAGTVDPVELTAETEELWPGPAAFDPIESLLYEAIEAGDGPELEAVLERCEVAAYRDAVRRLLAREDEAERLLRAPNLSGFEATTSTPGPSPRVRRLASFLGDELGSARRRLLRFAHGARLPIFAFFGLVAAFHAREPVLEPHILLEMVGFFAVAALTWGLERAAGARRFSDPLAMAFGVVYAITGTWLMAYFHASHELHRYGVMTGFGPHVLWIGLLPLILSVRLPALLAVSTTAALAGIGGFFTAATVYGVEPWRFIDAEALGALPAAVAFSVLVQRVVAALGREIAASLRFGSYVPEQRLGQGGMGEVWLARHPLLARPAAVKVIRRDHLERSTLRREELLERFLLEARTTASLESPHTVRVFDYGVLEDGQAFLAMEYLDGIDLRTLIDEHGPQPVDRVRSILLQVCDSLDEAHGKGLVHRDLKPANLMLCRADRRLDQVKVLDFGVVQVDFAAELEASAQLTRPGALLGTPGYLAPELLAGAEVTATPRSDLYALACVAYALLTGRPVFAQGPAVFQLSAHLRDAPTPPSNHIPDLPEAWDALLLACLAKRPVERPASIAELAERIEAIEPVGDWSSERQSAWWSGHSAI